MNEPVMLRSSQILDSQFLARRAALDLWVKTNIQPSRNAAILSVCKRAYHLRGNKYQVLETMNQMRDNLMLEHTPIAQQVAQMLISGSCPECGKSVFEELMPGNGYIRCANCGRLVS